MAVNSLARFIKTNVNTALERLPRALQGALVPMQNGFLEALQGLLGPLTRVSAGVIPTPANDRLLQA